MQRREFLKLIAQSGALGGLAAAGLPTSVLSADPAFNDYRALVCVFLHGGNDSLNMFVPIKTGTNSGHDVYTQYRPNIGVSNTDLSSALATFLSNKTNPYSAANNDVKKYRYGAYHHTGMEVGTNGLMPELASLINSGNVAIVSNVGTLVESGTKLQYLNNTKRLPSFLFAHNHQRRIMQNCDATNLQELGWGGRLLDAWQGINGDHVLGMNVSYAGKADLFSSQLSNSLTLQPGKLPKFKDMYGTWATHTEKKAVYTNLFRISPANNHARIFNKSFKGAFELADVLAQQYTANNFNFEDADFSSKDSYGNALFAVPTKAQTELSDDLDARFFSQLEEVARMAKVGKTLGLKRQLFYVTLGGFDTHSRQPEDHAYLLRSLSVGVDKFYKAMTEFGMANEVTAFTMSDFGRAVKENGDGTDHAWAASHFVLGGAVNGGFYGELPDLRPGGEQDISTKGRLIPTIGHDQYVSSLFSWFGADTTLRNQLIPNLSLQTSGLVYDSETIPSLFSS